MVSHPVHLLPTYGRFACRRFQSQVFRLAGGTLVPVVSCGLRFFAASLTAGEHTELGAWNGKVATEPGGHLRAAATCYATDDPVQGRRTHASNSVVNLVSAAFVTPLQVVPVCSWSVTFPPLRAWPRLSPVTRWFCVRFACLPVRAIADAVGVVTGYQDLPDRSRRGLSLVTPVPLGRDDGSRDPRCG